MVRRFLEEKSPETEVRRLMETTEGYDPAVWGQMAEQLGLQSLDHPRGVRRLGLRLRRADRGARGDGRRPAVRPVSSPRWRSAANACSPRATTRPRSAYLPGIASGETIATVALTEDNGQLGLRGIELAATPTGDGWVLNGRKTSSSTATSPT